ncbi:MAG: SUMF1/EgtB/PvdO family nonheme iron enzyme [Verrucomicrobia bacterium]|nr:SUMF1/EgtB/PvdO family nonheme iron enzyme [Verrucomicrobiota bacterium]
MKTRPIDSCGLLMLAGISFVTPAFAAVNINLVYVGNPNVNDSRTGFGGVTGAYQIMQYEVTNSQFAEFLNAVATTDPNGLFNVAMGTDARGGITRSGESGSYTYAVKANMADKPVNYVSFHDAARFANWLHNLQPTGLQTNTTTEDGAYQITGPSVIRNGTATVWIPTENEWYKAAYYNGAGANYSLYPTQSDTAPTMATVGLAGDISNPGANVANYFRGADWNGEDGNVTTVGTAGAASYYGTFDQGGNVAEWNEDPDGLARRVRGGSFEEPDYTLYAGTSFNVIELEEYDHLGFRLAVPEPTSPVLALLAAGGLPLMRRKRV